MSSLRRAARWTTCPLPIIEGARIAALRVQPLPAAAARALLSHRFPRLSGRAQARILEQAAGNPLALIELPSPGVVGGDDVTHGRSSDALPLTRRLQAVFARRLDGLSSAARALLLTGGGRTSNSPASHQPDPADEGKHTAKRRILARCGLQAKPLGRRYWVS